jgi:adenylate kinase
MASVNTQPKLKVHVLCSGIRYGNGERIFYEHFQKAWFQRPNALPCIGNGRNRVPTIHVLDLARLVRRIVLEPSQSAVRKTAEGEEEKYRVLTD